MSTVHRMSMEFESKFLDSLRIKAEKRKEKRKDYANKVSPVCVN